jgi:hypothetical protein
LLGGLFRVQDDYLCSFIRIIFDTNIGILDYTVKAFNNGKFLKEFLKKIRGKKRLNVISIKNSSFFIGMRRRSSLSKNRGISGKREICMLEHPFCFLSFISCTYLHTCIIILTMTVTGAKMSGVKGSFPPPPKKKVEQGF